MENSPLFERRMTMLKKNVLRKKKKCSALLYTPKYVFYPKNAFMSAAVVNIANELRTVVAQAQGAGSRAVYSSVFMETLVRDHRRSWNGEFHMFSTDFP